MTQQSHRAGWFAGHPCQVDKFFGRIYWPTAAKGLKSFLSPSISRLRRTKNSTEGYIWATSLLKVNMLSTKFKSLNLLPWITALAVRCTGTMDHKIRSIERFLRDESSPLSAGWMGQVRRVRRRDHAKPIRSTDRREPEAELIRFRISQTWVQVLCLNSGGGRAAE